MTMWRSLIAVFGLAVWIAAGPAHAQAPEAGGQTQALVDELRGLVGEAERQGYGARRILRDLRDLANRYDYPWRRTILSNDFSQEGAQPPAPWRVVAGEFRVDWRYGLRSVVQAPQPKPEAKREEPAGEGETARRMFESFLKEALREPSKEGEAEPAQPAQPDYAAAIAPVAITNAFAVEAEITGRAIAAAAASELELGPYVGADAQAGYRLVYRQSGARGTPSMALIHRTGPTAFSTLRLAEETVDLLDEAAHRLAWRRDREGRMTVEIDGQTLFEVTDRAVTGAFDGFAVVNHAGDFALRRITIAGTP